MAAAARSWHDRAGMRYLAGIVFITALLVAAAPAGAHTIAPGWGYAEIDEQPFNEPGGGLLPANQAYPRGRVKDLGTPDDSAVRINVTAVGEAGQTLHTYGVTERHAVYTDYSQRITATAPIAYLRYDFCKTATGVCAAPYVINRPVPPGGGGGNTPPLPLPEDRDQDGSRVGVDCDDRNSTVRPGAPERPGNGLDDDCVGGDQPARLYASLGIGWAIGKVNTSLRRLRLADAPPGARVTGALPRQALPLRPPRGDRRRERPREPAAADPPPPAARHDARDRRHRAEHGRQGRALPDPPRQGAARAPALPAAGRVKPGRC